MPRGLKVKGVEMTGPGRLVQPLAVTPERSLGPSASGLGLARMISMEPDEKGWKRCLVRDQGGHARDDESTLRV